MENNTEISNSNLTENRPSHHKPNNYFRKNNRNNIYRENNFEHNENLSDLNNDINNDKNSFRPSSGNDSYKRNNVKYEPQYRRNTFVNHGEFSGSINSNDSYNNEHFSKRNYGNPNNKKSSQFDRFNSKSNYMYKQNSDQSSFNIRDRKDNRFDERNFDNMRRSGVQSFHRNGNKYYNNNKKNEVDINTKCDKEKVGLNQRDSLMWQLSNNNYECMICVTNIRFDAATWSCNSCFHIFHVACISKWATTCENAVNKDGIKMNLRCPACQKEYDVNNKELSLYRCFCGKQINPVSRRGQVPHCCDDVCGKSNKSDERCPHLCQLLCHPGPCPSCEAIVTRNCQCGQTRISTKCNADERTLICGSHCNKLLNCGVHTCAELCHAGNCSNCEVVIYQKCWCNRQNERKIICGTEGVSSQFGCGENCERILNCSNHKCDQLCHEGDCKSCQYTPDLVDSCYCGKTSVEKLTGKSRQNCLDIIPSCGMSCGKIFDKCGHPCERQCHEGVCEPCPLKRDLLCRCKKSTIIGVECVTLEFNPVLCNKLCNKKLLCGRHRCNERCCDAELHLCMEPCGRLLSCKSHFCERECGHLGICPSCHNVSFDELHCECGTATSLPPIACGQTPPICQKSCTRSHDCEHLVRHNCHNDMSCPPCTVLTSKSCPGNHRILDNVPCFRPVATCGLTCNRSLPNCSHSCIKVCHQGNCLNDNVPCTQPCTKLRNDCNHPCAAPCHTSDCQNIMTSCTYQVLLTCSCKVRSVAITCNKLQNTISLIKFNNSDAKRENLDIILSNHDGTVLLTCDNECKRVARQVKLADAFDISITTSNLNTYYSDSLKNFAKKNIEFLIHIEKILLDLMKNIKNTTDLIHTHTIRNITEDKTDFINRYSSCFKMNCKCSMDQSQKMCITIEVNRSNCCTPKPLLSDLLKSECPHLFQIKNEVEKNKAPSTTSLVMSFADRIRLTKKE